MTFADLVTRHLTGPIPAGPPPVAAAWRILLTEAVTAGTEATDPDVAAAWLDVAQGIATHLEPPSKGLTFGRAMELAQAGTPVRRAGQPWRIVYRPGRDDYFAKIAPNGTVLAAPVSFSMGSIHATRLGG